MKNKKVLAVVGALVVIVGLYGAYRVYNHFKRLSATPAGQAQTATTAPETLGSLKDLIAKGISQSCSYSTNNTSGTVYMSGGQVRADINAEINNQTTTSHLIIANNTTYLWTDGRKAGIKMAYNPNATPAPAGSPTTNSSGVLDPNMSMNYNCSAWIADASRFALPAGITFSSFTLPSQTTGTAAPAAGSGSSLCSSCDTLTGDSKTQCLTALKCK